MCRHIFFLGEGSPKCSWQDIYDPLSSCMGLTNYICLFVHPQQNKGIESQKAGGGAWGHPNAVLSNLLAQAGSPGAGCPGLYLDDFWISLRIETMQPPWATSASAQLPLISEQIFPSAQRPPPTLWLVPLALCPVSGHCWNDALECAALHPPWSYLHTLAKSLLHLLFAKLKSQFPWFMLESEAACMPLNKPKPRKWFWPWNCNHAHCLAVNMLHDFLMVY